MSTVLRAHDLKHDREVAIKVFRGEIAASFGTERFLREISIAAGLSHPHILPLLDSGTAAGLMYYVMPFVQGESLRERLVRECGLPIRDAVRILVDVADALRYAHDRGIIHRDIKPENIMLTGRHALVADFGVARAVSGPRAGGTHTSAGFALGTPAYMAPEQAAADPAVDHRADLYALGVVAFEMLAGQPPFTADSPQAILAAQVTERPPPLASPVPDLPPGLTAVIDRCLAKRPAERWQRAEDLQEQLEPFVVPSGAVTPVATVPVPAVRRLGWALAVVATVALVSLGAAVGFGRLARGPEIRLGATHRLAGATPLELDAALSPDGRLLAYAAGRNGEMRVYVRQLAGGDPIAIAADVGGNQRWPRWSPDGSRIAFQAGGVIYLAPALGGAAQRLIEGSGAEGAGAPAWSPDGQRMAYVQGGHILVREVEGGAEAPVLLSDGAAHSLAWSPDGALLAYVSGNRDFVLGEGLLGNVAPSTVRVAAVAGGKSTAITDGRSLAVSPVWLDRRTLLYVSNQNGLRDAYLVRLNRRGSPEGAARRLTTGLGAHSIGLSADRKRLVYSVLSQDSNVWSVALPSASSGIASVREAEQVTSGTQVVEDLDVLPGGHWMAFDSNRGGSQDLYLMKIPNGRPVQLTRDSTDDFGPAWSPDGRELAFYAVRDGVRHIFVMRSDGRNIKQVTNDSLNDHQPHWSPEGTGLVFYRRDGQGRDRMYLVTRGPDRTWGPATPLTDEPGTGTTWSPAGDLIAFSDPEGNIRVIAPGGGPSRVLARPADLDGRPLRRPQWLPEERALLVRDEAPGGGGRIWRVALDGSRPREVVRFDDPTRPSYRDDYATDGRRVYFTVNLFEGSLWSMDLEGRQ